MNTTEQTSSIPSAGGENGVKLLLKYFPDLTEEQRKQFAALYELYIDWNSKINVISRKDIENLYEHHVLHSLGIARIIRFRAGSRQDRQRIIPAGGKKKPSHAERTAFQYYT